jgi:hypothetical protein
MSGELRSIIRAWIHEGTQERIPGGLASGKSQQDIADHHGVSIWLIKRQLRKGTDVEMEHTRDEAVAREIATDHIWEDPHYYDKLEKIEKD